ncbi:unnamed protein product [Triticum turgidum subsp. durum]|uniref:4-(cytidine-5'-diphospho)-2-C-methyl-D-erythritol kinase n=1 Tax=Triticum turgidum subsp. durum TaxID=4567 RepID=A0A9R0RRI5_TRITD|nr:unnamed protein product [Triticum turgidum subsp. durum]
MSNRATHWCYACRRPIRLRGQDIICPNCNDGFIQEISETRGALNNYGMFGPRFDDRLDGRFGMMDAMSALMRRRMAEMGSNPVFDPNAAWASTTQGRPSPIGPRLIFGSNMPAQGSDDSGVNVLVRGGRRIGADRPNFSGFLVGGPSLEALFEQLLLQTGNRQGPAPAPQSVIDSMPVVRITRRHLSDDPVCPVCTERFEIGSEAREMPCKHLYHASCIIPWLVQHNSCPVCRHPLPPQRGSDNNAARPQPSAQAGEAVSRGVDGAGADPGPVMRNGADEGGSPFSFLWPFGSSSSGPSSYQYGGGGGEPAPALCSFVKLTYDAQAKFNQLADQIDQDVGITRLNLFSPCKINVFLRITGKRPDGFHDLASLFHVVSLGDTIKFSLSPSKSKDRLSTNVAGVPVDDSNLIIRALDLYRKKTGTDKHFWIHLDKKVPTGAGLGGGSSNAATALWAANQFSGGIASEKDLQEWSGEIGSDIPFFFSRGAAYCTGRGEIVQDIPNLLPENLRMVLIKPPEACATAEVYKRLRLDQTSKADPLALLKEITQNGISQDVCVNDLEPPAFEVLRSLKKLKKRFIASNRGDYSAVFMSGSGSTIVGIGSPDPPAFVYDDDDYKDVFVSEARFLTRDENEWYREPMSSNARFSKEDSLSEAAPVVD